MSRLVGKPAPSFSADAVFDGDFKTISLDDYKGKWKVLFFYPLDFTFVCPTEIIAFSDAVDKFKEINCEVLGCSIDSKFTHLAWTQTSQEDGGVSGTKYPLISDLNKSIARDYEVLIDEAGIALRGLFILDENHIIQHATINNLSVGRNVEEVLRLVKAFQHTAKHGEVCPAGWNTGDETMKPDPQGSKSWFKNNKA